MAEEDDSPIPEERFTPEPEGQTASPEGKPGNGGLEEEAALAINGIGGGIDPDLGLPDVVPHKLFLQSSGWTLTAICHIRARRSSTSKTPTGWRFAWPPGFLSAS